MTNSKCDLDIRGMVMNVRRDTSSLVLHVYCTRTGQKNCPHGQCNFNMAGGGGKEMQKDGLKYIYNLKSN